MRRRVSRSVMNLLSHKHKHKNATLFPTGTLSTHHSNESLSSEASDEQKYNDVCADHNDCEVDVAKRKLGYWHSIRKRNAKLVFRITDPTSEICRTCIGHVVVDEYVLIVELKVTDVTMRLLCPA